MNTRTNQNIYLSGQEMLTYIDQRNQLINRIYAKSNQIALMQSELSDVSKIDNLLENMKIQLIDSRTIALSKMQTMQTTFTANTQFSDNLIVHELKQQFELIEMLEKQVEKTEERKTVMVGLHNTWRILNEELRILQEELNALEVNYNHPLSQYISTINPSTQNNGVSYPTHVEYGHASNQSQTENIIGMISKNASTTVLTPEAYRAQVKVSRKEKAEQVTSFNHNVNQAVTQLIAKSQISTGSIDPNITKMVRHLTSSSDLQALNRNIVERIPAASGNSNKLVNNNQVSSTASDIMENATDVSSNRNRKRSRSIEFFAQNNNQPVRDNNNNNNNNNSDNINSNSNFNTGTSNEGVDHLLTNQNNFLNTSQIESLVLANTNDLSIDFSDLDFLPEIDALFNAEGQNLGQTETENNNNAFKF